MSARVVIQLTPEEVAVLGLAADNNGALGRRERMLVARIAARAQAAAEDARVTVPLARRPRVMECPSCHRALRFDSASIGSLMDVFYCPCAGCTFTLEISR